MIGDKYCLVYSKEEANKLVAEGYKLHTYTAIPIGNEMHQGFWVMSLSSSTNLEGVTNIVNVDLDKNTEDGTPLIVKMVNDGWKITATYSKHATLTYAEVK